MPVQARQKSVEKQMSRFTITHPPVPDHPNIMKRLPNMREAARGWTARTLRRCVMDDGDDAAYFNPPWICASLCRIKSPDPQGDGLLIRIPLGDNLFYKDVIMVALENKEERHTEF